MLDKDRHAEIIWQINSAPRFRTCLEQVDSFAQDLPYVASSRLLIGIRVSLGATRTDIARMVLREAFGMSSAGLVIGALLAYWGKRFVASLIPGLPVQSVVPIVFGTAVMVALALLAAYTPARRPLACLRWKRAVRIDVRRTP